MQDESRQTARHRLTLGIAAASCALIIIGCGTPQPAATETKPSQGSVDMNVTKAVLERHQKTFGSQDLEGVMADYAADAVMFTPGGEVRGSAALRANFVNVLAEWGKPGGKFQMVHQVVDGPNAAMFWNAETADNVYEGGVDAFVVQNGKIVSHFFSAKITPKTAAKK